MRWRWDGQVRAGEEIAKLSDGICSLRLHTQKRQPDLREDRIDKRVAVPTSGKEMAAVIDLNRGDWIESEDVADHEVDALRHNGVEGPAAKVDVGALGRICEFGQPHLRERTIVAAERRRGVLEEYRQDIIRKDGYAITKLVLNHNVLFHHINTQEEIDSARKRDAQFDGIGPSHLDELVEIFATSKDKLEGKLQNIEIRQDGPLGMVTFNYDFYVNDKLTNSGLEHWQLCKIDGQWKILSVTWTSYHRS